MSELKGEPFISLPRHEGAVLPDRLRRLSHAAGFAADVVQIAPDSWTAISLVAAEVGCTLTLSTVATNVVDPHVRFLRLLDETDPVMLRMVWREDDDSAALHVVLALSEQLMPTVQDSPQRK